MPQACTPYLLYEDAAAAIDWLGSAFGFRERLRFADEGGRVTHAELTLGDAEVMLGNPGPDYRSPRALGGVTHLTHVYVDDVDAHFAQARLAGAEIVREPEDEAYGDRRYDAKDPEGHLWSFATLLREVPAAEWGAQLPARPEA